MSGQDTYWALTHFRYSHEKGGRCEESSPPFFMVGRTQSLRSNCLLIDGPGMKHGRENAFGARDHLLSVQEVTWNGFPAFFTGYLWSALSVRAERIL